MKPGTFTQMYVQPITSTRYVAVCIIVATIPKALRAIRLLFIMLIINLHEIMNNPLNLKLKMESSTGLIVRSQESNKVVAAIRHHINQKTDLGDELTGRMKRIKQTQESSS